MNSAYSDNTIAQCPTICLDKHTHHNGSITVVENDHTVPFDVKRVFYLYDVPGGANRGGHAHYELFQFIVAASGSFDVVLDDGENRRTVSLNRPYHGLLVAPGVWSELQNFSSGAVCLVLASDTYSEPDYIRDYSQYLVYKNR